MKTGYSFFGEMVLTLSAVSMSIALLVLDGPARYIPVLWFFAYCVIGVLIPKSRRVVLHNWIVFGGIATIIFLWGCLMPPARAFLTSITIF